MKVRLHRIESSIFDRNVYEIIVDKPVIHLFRAEEENLVLNKNPFYLQCTVESVNLALIHFLETCGFNFVEYRMKCSRKLDETIKSYHLFPYKLEEVFRKTDLYNVIKLVKSQPQDDRFFSDPIMKQELAVKRATEFIKKSFRKKNEKLLILVNSFTNDILGYKSIGVNKSNDAILYLTGIDPKFNHIQNLEIINTLLFSYLKERGICFAHAFLSGGNTAEIDLFIKKLEFTITGTYVVLRKMY